MSTHLPENQENEQKIIPADPFAAFENPQFRSKENLEQDKQKKKKILLFSLIGAAIVLVAAIILLVFVFPEKDDTNDTPTTTSVTVLDKTTEKVKNSVVSATLTTKDGVLNIGNKEDELFIKGYEDLPVEISSVESTGGILSKLVATDDVGTVDSVKDFGLDKPIFTADVTYYDNSTFAFEIGNATPDKTGYYFREKGKDHIYVMSTANAEWLMTPADKYISSSVFDAPNPSSDDAQVVMRDMTLSGTVRNNEKLSFRLVTSEDSEEYIYHTYILTAPKIKGTNSSYASKMENFTYLVASDIAAVRPTEKQLQEFGLTNPYSVAEFTLASRTTTTDKTDANGNTQSKTVYSDLKKHVIKVGGMKNDQYYVMIDTVPIVYTVYADDLPWVTVTFDEMADTMLFLNNISTISNYTVTLPDKTTTFHLTHDPSTDDRVKSLTVDVNGTVMDTMNFRYLVLVSMEIQRYGALKTTITDQPLKLTLTLDKVDNTEQPLVIRFYELSASVYGVKLSTGEEYEVKASQVKNFIQQYENYLAGKDVLY